MSCLHVRLISVRRTGANAGRPRPRPAGGRRRRRLVVPQSTCVKPEYSEALEVRFAHDRPLQQEYKTYAECVKKYVADNKAMVDKIIATANDARRRVQRLQRGAEGE